MEKNANNGNGKYAKNDIFYKAIEALVDNTLQKTLVLPDGCEHTEQESCGGCATCAFKCGKAFSVPEAYAPTTDDPYAERNDVTSATPPEPETTFPLLQMVCCAIACIVGCYFANGFFMHLLGRG